jgi:cyclophilin family peptidyl-prolyl cis-trans isomerase
MTRWLAHLLVPVAIVVVAALFVLVIDAAGDISGVPRTGAPLVAGPEAPETECEQYVPVSATDATAPRPPDRPPPGGLTAIAVTSCGEMEIRLASAAFPRTVASFVHLAEQGVYDNTEVHRIVPGQLIEAGDPSGSGRGGPGYAIRERPPAATTYPPRTVAMARAPDEPSGTSGSRFFVVTGARARLPAEYAVIGRVTRGFDVARTIEGLAEDGTGPRRPRQPVVLTTVRIER